MVGPLSDQERKDHLSDLEKMFADGEAKEIRIPYINLAVIFPSNVPHSRSFEHNCIDENALREFIHNYSYELQTLHEGEYPENFAVFKKK